MTDRYNEVINAAKRVPIDAEIARRGINLRRVGVEIVGPCPLCGGSDRFAINRAKQVWNCRGCAKGGDVIDLVRHLDGSNFNEACETLTGSPPPRNTSSTHRRENVSGVFRQDTLESVNATAETGAGAAAAAAQQRKARWLWSQGKPVAGTIAETYLRSARGYGGALPGTIRFLPARGRHGPAMIAPFGLPNEPEPCRLVIAADEVMAVHITKLSADGFGKAGTGSDKIMIGRSVGSPIVLAPANDLLGMVITEGIEDALSACEATGLGAWAAGSASRMPAIAGAIPTWIECVTIIADDDFVGRRDAAELATRLRDRRIDTRITPLGIWRTAA
jgi:phage/plasmid primase-like uncharacterized protein